MPLLLYLYLVFILQYFRGASPVHLHMAFACKWTLNVAERDVFWGITGPNLILNTLKQHGTIS